MAQCAALDWVGSSGPHHRQWIGAAVELAGGLGPTIALTYLENKPTVLIVSFKEL